MATSTVGDFLLERLAQWGVRRIYGYPGDGINGIMGAFGRRYGQDGSAMRFVQARAYVSALIKRDPDSVRMVTASAKEWWDGVRPRMR